MCLLARTAFGFSVAARKLMELKPSISMRVKSLLAYSLDDMFVQGRVADWVAYNLEAVDEKVLLTIAVLTTDGLRHEDDLDALLYGGKILTELDEDNILACIQMSRCKQVTQWV